MILAGGLTSTSSCIFHNIHLHRVFLPTESLILPVYLFYLLFYCRLYCFRYAGRYAAAATATGNKAMHIMEHASLMKEAIGGVKSEV